MSDTNINTIERKIEGDLKSLTPVVAEVPVNLEEEITATPHPETFYSNELESPTKDAFISSTPLPSKQKETTTIASPVLVGEGYEINEVSGKNPALPLLVAKINKEDIPSKY